MRKLLIISFILLPFCAFTQSIDREIVAAGGDYFETSTTNIAWTLGELVIGNFSAGDLLLSQGFQQGNMIISSAKDLPEGFELRAYPNPVVDILIIESEIPDRAYRLVDIHGKLLDHGFVRSTSYELDLSEVPSGIYFLWVEDKQTHKIIKK